MAYEVPARPIRRSRRPILVPPLLAVAVVAAALLAGPSPVPAPPASDGPTPAADATHTALPATPAPLAAGVTSCRELGAFACRVTVRAAQLALDPGYPPIASATAWRSLICGDDFDCPHSRLTLARPAGSVVFTFADRSTAWVNVVWLDISSRRFEDGTERLAGWVVRWFGPDS